MALAELWRPRNIKYSFTQSSIFRQAMFVCKQTVAYSVTARQIEEKLEREREREPLKNPRKT